MSENFSVNLSDPDLSEGLYNIFTNIYSKGTSITIKDTANANAKPDIHVQLKADDAIVTRMKALKDALITANIVGEDTWKEYVLYFKLQGPQGEKGDNGEKGVPGLQGKKGDDGQVDSGQMVKLLNFVTALETKISTLETGFKATVLKTVFESLENEFSTVTETVRELEMEVFPGTNPEYADMINQLKLVTKKTKKADNVSIMDLVTGNRKTFEAAMSSVENQLKERQNGDATDSANTKRRFKSARQASPVVTESSKGSRHRFTSSRKKAQLPVTSLKNQSEKKTNDQLLTEFFLSRE